MPVPSSSLRSSPIPLPLRPRHRLTRVRGPHATPRAADLAAPAAARLGPTRGPHRTLQRALTWRDDEAANARGFLSSIPEVRTYVLRRQRFSATVVCACLVVRKFVHDLAILNNAAAVLMSGDLEQLGEGVLS